jgi:hypothetical protein
MLSLEKIADGLYVSETTRAISFKPKEFKGYLFGKLEYEEIADVFLDAAEKQNQWVGIGFNNYLRKQLLSQIEENDKYEKQLEEENKSFTTTIYEGFKSLFDKKQKLKKPHVSWIAMNGPDYTMNIVKGMANKGYIEIVNLLSLEQDMIILPTEKFFKTLTKY